MNKHKSIVLFAYLPVLAFALFHWVMWHSYVEPVAQAAGDLSRAAYIQISPQAPAYDSDIKKFTGPDARSTDILTIGGDFFRLNFQKYLSQETGLEVINLTDLKWQEYPHTRHNPVNMLALMVNSGYLDQIHPKVIILGIAQYRWYEDLIENIDLNLTANVADLRTFLREYPDPQEPNPSHDFVNDGNYKFLYNNHLLKRSGGEFTCYSGQVCSAALTQRMFSGNYPNLLFFARRDFGPISNENNLTIGQAIENLNQLAYKLAARNIELFVFIFPDKYTYYQYLLKDTGLPRSQFFENYHALPKNYLSLNEMPHMEQEDAYWPQDTRWNESYQRYVAHLITDRLKQPTRLP